MATVGYVESDFVGDQDLIDLEKSLSRFDISLIKEHSKADILLVFSDHDLLSMTNEKEPFPPVLVIETRGDTSFFSQQHFDKLDTLAQIIHDREYYIENRIMIEVVIDTKRYLALNDVYITSNYPNTRMRYDILVDQRSVFDDLDSANGILVSTPTGSTAMALNLGGALIHPTTDVFQLVTVASRNVLAQNQILPATALIDIEILDTQFPLFIQIDSIQVETSNRLISMKKADRSFPLVILDQDKRSSSLQQKLTNKLSFEDTKDLTSSAKFILHVLQQESMGMTVNEIMDITHLHNQKTLRNSLNLLISKGLVIKRDNLEDMRQHIYSYSKL